MDGEAGLRPSPEPFTGTGTGTGSWVVAAAGGGAELAAAGSIVVRAEPRPRRGVEARPRRRSRSPRYDTPRAADDAGRPRRRPEQPSLVRAGPTSSARASALRERSAAQDGAARRPGAVMTSVGAMDPAS